MKTSGKSFGVSVLGIGHSDIRGLVTYRSMVRREPCCLLAWITVPCADIVQSQMARTLKWPKPFQDASSCFCCRQMYVAQATLHLLDYPQQRQAGNVKGLPPQAVLCTLDFDGMLLYLHGSCDIAGHHAPYKAGQFPGNRCFCHVCFFAAG